jgi:hypothetical protein
MLESDYDQDNQGGGLGGGSEVGMPSMAMGSNKKIDMKRS